MNNEQLDKQFRNFLRNDDSELTPKELNAKENIWQALDRPKSSSAWIWKVAVVILLLLLGAVFGLLQNKVAHQTAQHQQLQLALMAARDSLQQAKGQLQQSESQLATFEQQQFKSSTKEQSTTIIKYQDKYIDRIIEQKDTILIEKVRLQAPDTVVVRDTVWVQVPITIASTTPDQQKKQPSKVEFLFNKPPSKSKYKLPIYINEQAVAKKPSGGNQGIITITIN